MRRIKPIYQVRVVKNVHDIRQIKAVFLLIEFILLIRPRKHCFFRLYKIVYPLYIACQGFSLNETKIVVTPRLLSRYTRSSLSGRVARDKSLTPC